MVSIQEFQDLMHELYFHNDSERGIHRTSLWLVEEVGELMEHLKHDEKTISDKKDLISEEMADIYAWIASIANLLNIDLEAAVNKKYPNKCIKCEQNPCVCKH